MKNLKLLSICIIGIALISFTSCTPEPVADFSADSTDVDIDETITFTNSTTDGESYEWDFGDGSTSTAEGPTHSYSAAGTYTVKLTAYSKKEKKSNEKTLSVTVYGPTIMDFTVIEYYDLYYVEDLTVTVYGSQDDWNNETNYLAYAYTDAVGYCSFTATPSTYFIDASGYDIDYDWHDNWDTATLGGVETGQLTRGAVNSYTIYVIYDPNLKSYVVKDVKRNLNPNSRPVESVEILSNN